MDGSDEEVKMLGVNAVFEPVDEGVLGLQRSISFSGDAEFLSLPLWASLAGVLRSEDDGGLGDDALLVLAQRLLPFLEAPGVLTLLPLEAVLALSSGDRDFSLDGQELS